ncbi:MAG: hypothetical protein QM691_00590 [Opitutaceae bacterium]
MATSFTTRPASFGTPLSQLLFVVFMLALITAAVSTQKFVKRLDLPPPGVFLVIAGEDNPLFVKLAQTSIKGLHRAVALHAQLEVPGEAAPRPLPARSQNSTDWEKKLKTPQLSPGKKPSDLESNIAVLLRVAVPADPKLYGRTIPAAFDLEMVVPRLDRENPKVGAAIPDRVTWTVQLQIQPPGFLRVYQKLNRGALAAAGAVLIIALLRFLFRRKPRAT